MEEILQKFVNQMNEKFDRIDEKFDRIDEKFAKIDEKFAKIDEKFDRIDERFNEMDQRFNQLETNTKNELENFKTSLEQKMEDTKKEILDRQFLFEQEYGSKIDIILDAVKLEMEKNIEKSEDIKKLDTRMERAKLHLFNHEARIDRIEMPKEKTV